VRRIGLLIALFLILAAAAVAVYLGEQQDERIDLSSVMEIWGDVLRDADGLGLQLTRVSTRKEMEIGEKLAALVPKSTAQGSRFEAYVAAVGATLAEHVGRRRIEYRFHVVPTDQINAFAFPGGQIYITRGMLGFLKTEAELAAILGHEIAHVDLRHCIERFQYQLALKRVGLGGVGKVVDLARVLATVGYNKYQEIDADAEGVRLSVAAGYDPEAIVEVFDRLHDVHGRGVRKRARTPAGEVVRAVTDALGSYFDSHPPSAERARRLSALVQRNRRRLAGKSYYVGKANYEQRKARSVKAFPGETRKIKDTIKGDGGIKY
jgi:predicted Zn-dependent protease